MLRERKSLGQARTSVLAALICSHFKLRLSILFCRMNQFMQQTILCHNNKTYILEEGFGIFELEMIKNKITARQILKKCDRVNMSKDF